ncbi:hypothetical protein CHS0354_037632 [Potamilus streckersoni]|uniref:Actin-modulator n=1 Tax=Potamilus streckersoni TaxID=2493646 RepID=A0AAE0T7S2_9BIVA|nr:hypothetical protein CHS0354_037632 [Potamilus streckersoni]
MQIDFVSNFLQKEKNGSDIGYCWYRVAYQVLYDSRHGLRKQKQYDWKDSNLALFGSKTELAVKKSSADQEPAWRNAGQKVGLQIWRIVNFKVTSWPMEEYGKFYDGDSYIILNTYKKEGSNEYLYDVHFWIGKYSTADEYGTAAYKTVELDTFLNDIPVQHREVQDHESKLFKSYFTSITIMRGGAESGFRHVKDQDYPPRLFHFHGDKTGVEVKEIPRNSELLDGSDVFILDLGLKLYQWNGATSNKDERFKAIQYIQNLKSERGGKCTSEVLDEAHSNSTYEFMRHLDEVVPVSEEEYASDDADITKELYRLSDEVGIMQFTLEKTGDISPKDFDTKDVFIFDTKEELFVWIGKETTVNERLNALTYAHKYLQKTSHPFLPISCLTEGQFNSSFEIALAA